MTEEVAVAILYDDQAFRAGTMFYLNQMNKMSAETAKATQQIASSMAKVEKSFQKPAKATQSFTKTVSKSSKGVKSGTADMLAGFSRLSTALPALLPVASVLGFTKVVISSVNESLEEFKKFETGMAEVFTLIPQLSESARAQMDRDILELGQSVGRLSDETIPALYQAISAGVPAGNVMQFLETASDAARGGVTDLKSSVDVLTTVVNAYGMSASEAKKVSDLLFAAVQGGKTTFSELAKFAFNVVPVAASLGVEFGNVTAALAAMTKQGVNTRTATTQLRQVLVQLSKEGMRTAEIFEAAAGKSFQQFIADGNNLYDAMQLMEAAAADMGLSVNDLFTNIRAAQGALVLTGTGAALFANELERARTSSDAMSEAAATMEATLAVQEQKVAAVTEALMIQVGEGLRPAKQMWLEFKEAVIGALADTATTAVQGNKLEKVINEQAQAVIELGTAYDGLTSNQFDNVEAGYAIESVVGRITSRMKITGDRVTDLKIQYAALQFVMDAIEDGFKGTIDELADAAIAFAEFGFNTKTTIHDTLALGRANREAGKDVRESAQAHEEMAAILEGADEKITKYTQSMLGATDVQGAFSKLLLDFASSAGAGVDAIVEIARATGDYTEEQLEVTRLMGDMRKEFTELRLEAARTGKSYDWVTDQMIENWGTTINLIQAKMDEAEAVEEAQEAQEDYGAALAAVRQKQEEYLSSMGEMFNEIIDTKDEAGIFTHAIDRLGAQFVVVGGRTAEQNEQLERLRGIVEKSEDKLYDYEIGIAGIGASADTTSGNVSDLRTKMSNANREIERLLAIQGEVVPVFNEMTINMDAVNKMLYEQTLAAGADAFEMAALGIAIGEFSEAEAEAALKAAALMEVIRRVGVLIANGMGFPEAKQIIDDFIADLDQRYEDVLSGGPIFERNTERVLEMKEAWQEFEGVETPEVDVEIDTEDAQSALGDLEQGLDDAERDMGPTVKEIENTIAQMNKNSTSEVKDMTKEVKAGLKTMITDFESGMTSVNNAVSSGMTQALNDATAKASQFNIVGIAMVDGMIVGLDSRKGVLYDKIREIVNEAIIEAEKEAQADSPSKRTTELGSDLGEGLYLGFASWADLLNSLSRDMVNDAISNASQAANTGSGAFGSAMTSTMAQVFWQALSQGFMTPSMRGRIPRGRMSLFPFDEWFENVWVPGHPDDAGYYRGQSGDTFSPPGSRQPLLPGDHESREAFKRAKDKWVMETFGGWRNYDEYILQMLMAGNPGWTPESGGFPVGGFGDLPVGVGFGNFGSNPFNMSDDMFNSMMAGGQLFEATQSQINGIIETLLQQYGDLTSEAAEEWMANARDTGVLTFPPDFPQEIKLLIEELLSTGIVPTELLQALDFAIVDLELVLELIEMLEPQTIQWFNAMNRVFDVANDLAGSASFFANLYQEQVLGPIDDQINALIGSAQEIFDLSPEEILSQLPELIAYAQSQGWDEIANQLLELQGLQGERNELEEEYLAIQQQQQQLAFLQQQLDLLQTIRDAGLDPAEVLAGITLGLDASIPDLMAAISAMLQGMIGQIDNQLDISSPSGVGVEQGLQWGLGIAAGIMDSSEFISDALTDALGPVAQNPIPQPQSAMFPQARNVVVTVNFGDTIITSELDALEFQERVQDAVLEAIY